jgi:hypothetical protein
MPATEILPVVIVRISQRVPHASETVNHLHVITVVDAAVGSPAN